MKATVLYITDDGREYAGSEMSLLELLNTLDRQKFSPKVLCYNEGKFTEELKRSGVEVIVRDLGYPERTKNPVRMIVQFLALIRTLFVLSRIFKRERIGIVHSNKSLCAAISVLAAKMAGIPSLWHVRTFPKKLGFFAGAVIRLCDGLIFVSNALKSSYLSQFRDYESKFHVIYDVTTLHAPLGPPGTLKKLLKLPSNARIVGMIGHLSPVKKHDHFLACAALLSGKFADLSFVILGGTLEANPNESRDKREYGEKLKHFIRDKGLEKQVFFLGQRYDKEAFLSDMDVLVIPTQFETFGRVAVEAALAKVPVVAYDGGGVPELFEKDEMNFVSPGNISAMAEEIARLLNDSDNALMKAEKAFEKARVYGSGESTKQIETLYSRLLKGEPHAR